MGFCFVGWLVVVGWTGQYCNDGSQPGISWSRCLDMLCSKRNSGDFKAPLFGARMYDTFVARLQAIKAMRCGPWWFWAWIVIRVHTVHCALEADGFMSMVLVVPHFTLGMALHVCLLSLWCKQKNTNCQHSLILRSNPGLILLWVEDYDGDAPDAPGFSQIISMVQCPRKSGIVCSLNARTAILASANPADSCYNPKLSAPWMRLCNVCVYSLYIYVQ